MLQLIEKLHLENARCNNPSELSGNVAINILYHRLHVASYPDTQKDIPIYLLIKYWCGDIFLVISMMVSHFESQHRYLGEKTVGPQAVQAATYVRH